MERARFVNGNARHQTTLPLCFEHCKNYSCISVNRNVRNACYCIQNILILYQNSVEYFFWVPSCHTRHLLCYILRSTCVITCTYFRRPVVWKSTMFSFSFIIKKCISLFLLITDFVISYIECVIACAEFVINYYEFVIDC